MADVGKDLGNSADPKNIQDLTTFVSLFLLVLETYFVFNSSNNDFLIISRG